MTDLNIKPADILPLPARAEGFPFQRPIETKSERGYHPPITDINRACLARLARHGSNSEGGFHDGQVYGGFIHQAVFLVLSCHNTTNR
jgi:hypothetical protein